MVCRVCTIYVCRVVPSSIFCFGGECQLGCSVHGCVVVVSGVCDVGILFGFVYIYFGILFMLCASWFIPSGGVAPVHGVN